MAKYPADRYATAEELRADLLRFNEGRAGTGHGRRHHHDGRGRRHPGRRCRRRAWMPPRAVAATGPDGAEAEGEEDHQPDPDLAIILAVLVVLLAGGRVLPAPATSAIWGAASSFNLPVGGRRSRWARPPPSCVADGLVVKRTDQVSTTRPRARCSTEPAPTPGQR